MVSAGGWVPQVTRSNSHLDGPWVTSLKLGDQLHIWTSLSNSGDLGLPTWRIWQRAEAVTGRFLRPLPTPTACGAQVPFQAWPQLCHPSLPVGASSAPPHSSAFPSLAQGLGPALPCEKQTWCSCCCCPCCRGVSVPGKGSWPSGRAAGAAAEPLYPPRVPAGAARL